MMKSTNRARPWGDYDSKQVSMGFTEKVMFEHRLEGRRAWPPGGRMFQAEEPARKELGGSVPGISWEHPGEEEEVKSQALHGSDPLLGAWGSVSVSWVEWVITRIVREKGYHRT